MTRARRRCAVSASEGTLFLSLLYASSAIPCVNITAIACSTQNTHREPCCGHPPGGTPAPLNELEYRYLAGRKVLGGSHPRCERGSDGQRVLAWNGEPRLRLHRVGPWSTLTRGRLGARSAPEIRFVWMTGHKENSEATSPMMNPLGQEGVSEAGSVMLIVREINWNEEFQ